MFFRGRDRFGHQVSTHKTRANNGAHVSLCWVSFDIMPPPVDYLVCGCVWHGKIMSWELGKVPLVGHGIMARLGA